MIRRSDRSATVWRAGIVAALLGTLAGCIGAPSSPSGYRADTAFMLKYVSAEVGTTELAWRQHRDDSAPARYLAVVLRDAHKGLLSRFQGWQAIIPPAALAEEAAQLRALGGRAEELVTRVQTCAARQRPCDDLAKDLREVRESLREAIARWDG